MKRIFLCAIILLSSLTALAQTQSVTPTDLANMKQLEREAINYFWTQSNPNTGVTRDRAPNAPGSTTPDNGAGGAYDQCNISATGYALASYAVGVHAGYLNKTEALQRTRNTLAHFDTTDSTIELNGWFIQWLSFDKGNALGLYSGWPQAISTVDNGHLFAGILLAESAFKDPTVTLHANNIMKRVNWQWMLTKGGTDPQAIYYPSTYDPVSKSFSDSTYDDINEGADLVLIGIGDDPVHVPTTTWSSWYRPIDKAYGFETFLADSLYLHEMSEGYFDYFGKRDAQGYDYWVAARGALLMNRQYCIDLADSYHYFNNDIWGLSACDALLSNGTTTYVGYPYGGPWLPSSDGNDPGPIAYDNSGNGTIDPSATIAGIGYATGPSASNPNEGADYAIAAMNVLIARCPECQGEYGFYAGFNPTKTPVWHTPDALGIDLGPLVLAIQNQIDNMPHATMSENPIVRAAFKATGFHSTTEGLPWNRPLKI